MAAPNWDLIVTDLQGAVLGEITAASDVSLTLPLNRVPAAQFRMPIWHPMAPYVVNGDALLKVYRRDSVTNRLLFNGPILACDENGDAQAQSVAVTATGPFWRLTKRVIGQTKAGISFGTTAVPRDLGLIAFDVLDVANGNGYTGIEKGTRTNSTAGAAGPWWLKNAAEAIAELAVGINSFDYEVAPTEPTDVGKGWPKIGALNIAPLIGVQRTDAVFEYGTSRANVASYQRQINREALLTRALVSVSGWPDGAGDKGLIVQSDPTAINARGVYEEVVNDAGILDDGLRTQIANEHLKYRVNGRQTVTFSVATNASPYPFIDYNVGDWIRGRAVVRGSVRFDAMFRIWGITFRVDQNGNESLDLQLVQE